MMDDGVEESMNEGVGVRTVSAGRIRVDRGHVGDSDVQPVNALCECSTHKVVW